MSYQNMFSDNVYIQPHLRTDYILGQNTIIGGGGYVCNGISIGHGADAKNNAIAIGNGVISNNDEIKIGKWDLNKIGESIIQLEKAVEKLKEKVDLLWYHPGMPGYEEARLSFARNSGENDGQ